ncbi:Short-chain dehydrogenase [Oscillospiraceae bacterium]|nr:Short-chain dehydrogenase [Oscillospiraceae bacterium]
MLDLKNRWVLVTGAGRGIGRLMAEKLIGCGANLILVSRDKSHTEDIEKKAKGAGLQVVSFGCDLGVREEVKKLISELLKYDIDVVLNNAGIQVTYRSGVWDTPWDDFEKSFRVNTIAPMMICYALLPKMKEKGFGRILNTTSGIDRDPYQGPYSASKAALDKVTKDLEVTLNGEDILLFLTDPGWCRTDLGGPQAPNSPESAVNGCLAGAFASKGINGTIIHAQDYADKTLEEAVSLIENM